MLSLWGFYLAIRPFRIVSHITPKDFGIPYENISFTTQDHILIRGWFLKSPNKNAKTIILLHGYPADKSNILPSRLFLYPQYNLLFFDFRYFGQSEGSYSTVGKDEVLDLLAAIDYLKSRGIYQVGVWGFSLGGAVAIMTAPLTSAIVAIIAESSYARLDWLSYEYYHIPLLRYPLGALTALWAKIFLHYDIKQISPANIAKNLTLPILILHSKKDHVISIDHGLLFKEALRHNQYAKIIFAEQGLHGEPIQNYERTVKDFFETYL